MTLHANTVAVSPDHAPTAPVQDDVVPVLSARADGGRDLIAWSADRCAANLASATETQDYLRGAGIADPVVWADYRLGIGDTGMVAELDEEERWRATELGILSNHGRNILVGGGVVMPTYDPREPGRAVGLIRMTPAQHKHRFITPPFGVGCTGDIATAPRIVLADTPFLGLRLTQLGVSGVAIVGDAAVLPPLREWLATREVLIVGFRAARRAAMRTALGTLGERVHDVIVLPELERSPAASLVALGIGPSAGEAPPITPHLLRDLHCYALARLVAGAGADALCSLHIDNASFVSTYRIGYLPTGFCRALSTDQHRALDGRLSGNALVVPAYDAQGIVVDLMTVPVAEGAAPILSVHATPCGLIAAHVTTAFDDVIVVDSFRQAAAAAAQSHRNVLLLRGIEDAIANATRIAANGVRHAEVRCAQNAEPIAAALRAAGIAVSVAGHSASLSSVSKALTFPGSVAPAVPSDAPGEEVPSAAAAEPAPPADLVLVQHDERTEQATFRAGDLTYIAEVPWDERSRIGVRIQRGSQEHPDRLDLAEEAQRRRCASSAALRTGASATVIEAHLVRLALAVRELADRATALPPRQGVPPAAMTEEERASALDLARRPDLFERMIADVASMGWVGEESSKRFTILASLSRLLDEPVWAALTGYGAGGRSTGLDVIAAITPPEECIHLSRLTDNAFYYADPAALRHKLLIIDDASAISAGVGTALRILKRRGALSAPRIERDPVRGEMRTTFVEVHGPVAVLTATAETIDPQLQPYVLAVAADESPDQISRVFAERRRRLAQPGAQVEAQRTHIASRLRNLQRVIVPRPVVIPFAERIDGLGTSAHARRDHDTLLALIAAHALLHQHQRLSTDGSVVATMEDFAVGAALINERRAKEDAGLGRQAQRLLAAIRSAGLSSVTMEELSRLLPDWTRYAFRVALDELVGLDYLASPRSGRGAARTYLLHATVGAPGAAAAVPGIMLRDVGGLATVGDTGITNVTAVSGTG